MYDSRVGRFLSEDPIGDDPINEFRYVGNHPTYATDPSGLWDRAGHFWTTYMVAVAAGTNTVDANRLAYYSQLPDQEPHLDAINGVAQAELDRIDGALQGKQGMPRNYGWDVDINEWLHSLHGSAAEPRRSLLEKAFAGGPGNGNRWADWQRGFLLHAYGDSFAHTYTDSNGCLRLYSFPAGHGLQGHLPDNISSHTDTFKEYVDRLFKLLGGNGNDPHSMALINRIKRQADGLHIRHAVENSRDTRFSSAIGNDEASSMEQLARDHFGYQEGWFVPRPGAVAGNQRAVSTPLKSEVEDFITEIKLRSSAPK